MGRSVETNESLSPNSVYGTKSSSEYPDIRILRLKLAESSETEGYINFKQMDFQQERNIQLFKRYIKFKICFPCRRLSNV